MLPVQQPRHDGYLEGSCSESPKHAPLSLPGRGAGGEGLLLVFNPVLAWLNTKESPSPLTPLPGGERETRLARYLFQGYIMKQDARATGQARYLRNEMTPAEVILWKHLRGRRFDEFKFRRQRPVDKYIVDFVCLKLQLIVELDGESHLSKKERDQERDAFLEADGYRVLRYWNNQIYDETESVLEDIYLVCHGKK